MARQLAADNQELGKTLAESPNTIKSSKTTTVSFNAKSLHSNLFRLLQRISYPVHLTHIPHFQLAH
jgi:hypothetical protein